MVRQEPILRGVKKIYDEVHGYIELTELELKIVDTPTFQRLRYIKQLAAAWYVYPGATHTRFSHSIGTLHLMGIITSKFYSMGFIHYKDDIQLLRLVALLHDIGHPPFSHAIEAFYRERLGIGHEDFTKLIILRDPYISQLIEDYGYDPREIVAVLEGRHRERLFNQLISSDLDVDRMDYLLRDARHTGVTYGLIDIQRLLATMVVDGEGNIAVLEKGLDAVENFYLARLHMYRAVYYHKTIVGYEILIKRVYEKLVEDLDELSFLANMKFLTSIIENGNISFWHDDWLIGKMIDAMKRKEVSRECKKMISMFLHRQGYKVLKDLSYFTSDSEGREDVFRSIEMLSDLLKSKYGLSDTDVAVFSDVIRVVQEDENMVPRITGRGKSLPITRLPNSIVSSIPRKYIIARVYVSRDSIGKIGEVLEYC